MALKSPKEIDPVKMLPELSKMSFTESHKIKADKHLVNMYSRKDFKEKQSNSGIQTLGRLRQENYHKCEARLDDVVSTGQPGIQSKA